MNAHAVNRLGDRALVVAALIACIFFANVIAGGPLAMKPWLNDVQEMLTLFASVLFFVIATICREAAVRLKKKSEAE